MCDNVFVFSLINGFNRVETGNIETHKEEGLLL